LDVKELRAFEVEHLEEGLGEWCRLEYKHMASFVPPEQLVFVRWPGGEEVAELVPTGATAPKVNTKRLEELVPPSAAWPDGPAIPGWDRICLLDMDAEEALQPDDVAKFDAFVFGGILGNVIENEDGSYGSDDRTSEIRAAFKHRRHLGPWQMTTDSAMLYTQKVLEHACPLAEIPGIESPEFERPREAKRGPQDASDSVCMEGFRYMARRGPQGEWEPILPEGMKELLLADADNDILNSLQ